MSPCIRKGRVIALLTGKDKLVVYKIFREHYLNFIVWCRMSTRHLRFSDLFSAIGKNKYSIFLLRKNNHNIISVQGKAQICKWKLIHHLLFFEESPNFQDIFFKCSSITLHIFHTQRISTASWYFLLQFALNLGGEKGAIIYAFLNLS